MFHIEESQLPVCQHNIAKPMHFKLLHCCQKSAAYQIVWSIYSSNVFGRCSLL